MGSSNDQLSRWLEGRLNEVLGFQSSEIVSYILSLDNDSDRHSYLVEMLDPSRYAQYVLSQHQFSTKASLFNQILELFVSYYLQTQLKKRKKLKLPCNALKNP